MARLLFAIFLIGFISLAQAAPNTIVIIRHADKLLQHNAGQTLSPTGYIRSFLFAQYFLKNFGVPDRMLAIEPDTGEPHDNPFREEETLAPLANQILEKFPNRPTLILHNYSASYPQTLANTILHSSQYQHKLVLIAMDHYNMQFLLQALGIPMAQIPVWAKNIYDDVYVLRYSNTGKLIHYQLLKDQYPVKPIPNWKTFLKNYK